MSTAPGGRGSACSVWTCSLRDGQNSLPTAGGTQGSPHLCLLRGVGERQCVDAAGGQAGLEGLRAVSESDLVLLSGRGWPGCFQR